MNRLRISLRAHADLADISDWIAQDSPRTALRIIERLQDRIGLLIEHPLSGPARPEYGPAVRALSERPFLILYQVRNDVIFVERVVHGARAPDGLIP